MIFFQFRTKIGNFTPLKLPPSQINCLKLDFLLKCRFLSFSNYKKFFIAPFLACYLF